MIIVRLDNVFVIMMMIMMIAIVNSYYDSLVIMAMAIYL